MEARSPSRTSAASHAPYADGTGLRRVTNTPENETTEAWSRDGTRVLVDLQKLTGGAGLGKSDVAVVTMATGAIVNLTDTGGSNESHADWPTG